MPFAKVSMSRTTAVYHLFASFTSVSVYWLVYKHLRSSCPDVECQLTAPYASWIGSHNITLTWESLNLSDVVYILQWTGPSLSGVWAQAEVLDDFMIIFVMLMIKFHLLLVHLYLIKYNVKFSNMRLVTSHFQVMFNFKFFEEKNKGDFND